MKQNICYTNRAKGQRIFLIIESIIRDSVEGHDFLLVAETDNKLIGYISAQKGRMNRIAHSAYIVVGILTDYRGKGIGTEFFKR